MTLSPEHERMVGLGFSLLPIGTDGRKQPAFRAVPSWAVYQSRKATPEELQLWFRDAGTNNTGVVCGVISNLVVLDMDDDDSYEEVMARVPWLPEETMVVRTGRGWHVYIRPDPDVLAAAGGKIATSKFQLNGRTHHFKAEGSYVVCPPSIHENGNTYHWINNNDPLTLDPSILVRAVLSAGGVPDGGPKERAPGGVPQDWVARQLTEPCPSGARNDRATKLAGWFRNVIHYREDITLAILMNWSATWCQPPMNPDELESLVSHKYRLYAAE